MKDDETPYDEIALNRCRMDGYEAESESLPHSCGTVVILATMKAPEAPARLTDDALALLRLWAKRNDSFETIASRVGCSLRSVQNWLDGKRMTRLSAKAILAAKGKP